MLKEVIFDLETQKFFEDIEGDNPADLGVSVVSIYSRSIDSSLKEIGGELASFWENDLEGLWPIFQEADRIIGFNTLHFDVPVLQPYTSIPLNKLPHFDLFPTIKESAGKRIGLNSLAQETLDIQKSDSPLNAIYYWKQQDKKSLSKLQKYCEDDVIITKKLYDFGLKNKIVKYKDKWNAIRTIDVDFSYPKAVIEASQQKGLF